MSASAWARQQVRALMPVEGDLAFRRRCETIVEWTDAREGEVTLDCGCGYGFTLRVLTALRGGRFVGLDFQQERLDEVRRTYPHWSNVDLVQGSAMALPFADATFDHAVCSEVFEHLEDDALAARELYRVLMPGADLTVTVPSANFPLTWDPPNWLLKRLTFGKVQLRGERPWSGIWYGHRRLYAPAQLRRVLTDAGFEVIEQRGLSHVTPPFAHLLLYGIGKPLLQSGLLPKRFASQAGRTDAAPAQPKGLVARIMRVLEAIDATNDRDNAGSVERPAVALAIHVRKPGSGA